MEKRPARDTEIESHFPRSIHISDLSITLVATLPGAWGQCWEWLAWRQYTVTKCYSNLDLQLLSQCRSGAGIAQSVVCWARCPA